jgi:hypothetical protein
MNKQTERGRITISTSPKLDTQIRVEAARSGFSLSEMIEEYRKAWLEKLEREKEDRRRNKELNEKGQIKCPYCSQTIYRN